MAKKAKAEKPTRQLTRRQLSHYQKQRRRQRIVFTTGVTIVAVIILIVLSGWLLGEYLPMNKTVIEIQDIKFDMGYFIDTMRIAGEDQPPEALPGLVESVIRQIEENALIERGAAAFGIIVSNDEAGEQLEVLDIVENEASRDLIRVQLLQSRLYSEYFTVQVPMSDNQTRINAMLLESESQAAEIRARLQNSENFTSLAEEFSLHSYSKTDEDEISWHPQNVLVDLLSSFVPKNFAFGAEVGALSEPLYDKQKSKQVGYWLINVLDKPTADGAQLQGILLGSEEEAKDIRARLGVSENLTALVEEFSQHRDSKARGGEFGMVNRGTINEAIASYAFDENVEMGVWSEPLRDDTVITIGGYWLVQVLDKDDDRELSDEDRNYLVGKAYDDWVSSLWMQAVAFINHTFLTPEKIQWAIDRI